MTEKRVTVICGGRGHSHWNTATLEHLNTATLEHCNTQHFTFRSQWTMLFKSNIVYVMTKSGVGRIQRSQCQYIWIGRYSNLRSFFFFIKSVFLKGLWRPFNFFDWLSAISSELLLRVQECAHNFFKANFHIHTRCKCFVLSKKNSRKKLKFSILLSETYFVPSIFVDILLAHALTHKQISFLELTPPPQITLQ